MKKETHSLPGKFRKGIPAIAAALTGRKRRMLLVALCCLMAAGASGQFFVGGTAGVGLYQWDKSPVENATKATGGLFSEIAGPNVGIGDETFRFVLEGYQEWAPFTFSIKEFQGMGTFSAGALAKLSLTFSDGWNSRKGFSLGVGIETSRAELQFRDRDVKRHWYPTRYGYLAYSMFDDNGSRAIQTDVFCKAGFGSHSVMRMEVGIRYNVFFFL
jgi:hypothetical protein